MNLVDRAKQDIQTITSNSSEFGVPVVFLAPTSETVTINCLESTHHTSFDSTGEKINSKQSQIAVSELLLISLNYPYIDSNDEVSFKDHLLTFGGKTMIVNQWFPDRTASLIVLILGEYE